jgi:hypothetical protein
MKISTVDTDRAIFELSDREIQTIKNIFMEVKKVLNHEPEFQTRVGNYYLEGQKLIAQISNFWIVSLAEVTFVNNILNEACHGIVIQDFDAKIGIPESEAKLYLQAVNKVMNTLRSH